MKKIIAGVLTALFWIGHFSLADAASKVVDSKFSETNIASFREFQALPIGIDEAVDDNTKFKMRLIIKNEWSKSKVPIQWLEEVPEREIPRILEDEKENILPSGLEDVSENKMEDASKNDPEKEKDRSDGIGVLQIHISSYYWDNYWLEGYYEDYMDTEYYDDYYWENEYKDGKYVGRRKVWVRRSVPVLRTRYVPPRYVKQAIVQVSFVLRDPKTDEVIWYYDQNRLDTKGFLRSEPTLEKSLEVVSKEAAAAFEKVYKEDKKKLDKSKT